MLNDAQINPRELSPTGSRWARSVIALLIASLEFYPFQQGMGQEVTELANLEGHSQPVTSLAFTPDGKTLASGSYDAMIILWDVATQTKRDTLKEHSDKVLSVSFTSDGKMLASASYDRTVRLWDAVGGQSKKVLTQDYGGFNSVAFTPDGKTLVSGDWGEHAKLWDVDSGKEKAAFRLQGHVTSVAVTPNGKTFAAATINFGAGTIIFGDVATGKKGEPVKGQTGDVFTIAFSPDGKTLASGNGTSGDGRPAANEVMLWDVATGQGKQAPLKGHTGQIRSVVFRRDGKILASGSGDKVVKLWDAGTGKELATLKGHTGVVTSVAFSPDGKILASGSVDKTVKLWDVSQWINADQ